MGQRIIITFEPKQITSLKRVARQQRKSVGAVVRGAVNQYLEKKKKTPAALILESVEKNKEMLKAAFKNVDPHLSQKIDEIVYEDRR